MNILKNLLFSYKGKIGRADFIYGLIYWYLLIFVGLDALLQPKDWYLIWWWKDILFIIQYTLSIPLMLMSVWILGAVTTKRARTLWYPDIFGLWWMIIPPLTLLGLKKDTEGFAYNGRMSLTDQIFFYILTWILILCIWSIYQISFIYQILLSCVSIFAILCIILFNSDRDKKHTYPKQKYIGIDSFLDIVFVISIVLFVRLYFLSPFQIIWPSMESTFHGGNVIKNIHGQYGDGEFILVDKMTYRLTSPLRGDVVVFSPRIGPEKKYLIKRVIGLPGDTIQIKDGYVFIATSQNPEKFIKIDESVYLGKNYWKTCIYQDCIWDEPVKFSIPQWHYFLMGDNRQESLDSRQCFWKCDLWEEIRFIPESSISWRVAYSLGHFDMFEQILAVPPVLGTMRQVIPWRGKNILNNHTYTELE